MMKTANSLEVLSSLRSDPRLGIRNIAKIKNMKVYTEYYEKLNHYEEDEELRKELYDSIHDIKTKRKERILSRYNSQTDIFAKDLNGKIQDAKKKRVSLMKLKRK